MEETKSILSHATNKSLAIIDELGRGTATFDGLAIAYAVLKAIISRLKCYCLFATHYHILIDEFRGQPEVSLMMMDSLIKKDHIIFLFKLVPGSVAKSFGLCVASRVGINSSTIRIAEVEAEKMNNEIEGKRNALNQVI
jgi:DNA mismatch repair ATPase MutS